MFARFENMVDPYPPETPVQPPDRLFGFIVHYTWPMRGPLLASAVLVGLLSLIEVLFFGLMGELVDWLAAADRETFLADHGTLLILAAVLVLVVFPGLVLLHALVAFQTIIGNYPQRIRWMAHRYVLRQSLDYFQNEFAGRVSQKVMQTALAVREAIMKLFDEGVYILVYLIGAMYLLAQADVRLLAPLIVWFIGYVGLLFYFVPRLQEVSRVQSDARAEMSGRLIDSYTNIQTVKLFAHARREEDYAYRAMDGFMGTVHRQMRLVTVLTFLLHTLNSLLLVSVAAIAIYAWQVAAISLGAIAVAIGVILRIRNMSQWILWEVAALFENLGTIQDGVTTISRPIAITDRADAKALQVDRGEIRFDAARFHYGREQRVIHDFSLVVKPGEKVGLVGPSGAGKSTLVNLLLRFYDLESGRITIDGQDIAGVRQESLRGQIGMVTQDTSLLHRSVRDNIMYGRPDATEEAMRDAARRAHADPFIADLVDVKGRKGYDAHVGERGVRLSGGQRQRIAIARIFLKDAPILVLDEATSALDSEIEAQIQESLDRLMQGKTVIAIAHRLSTIAAMDRLVVLDQGEIAETGSHAELLEANGLYAQLWSRQSGGFLNPEIEHAEVA